MHRGAPHHAPTPGSRASSTGARPLFPQTGARAHEPLARRAPHPSALFWKRTHRTHAMPFALNADRERALAELLTRYPTKMAACIPLLHLCQEQNGYISEDVITFV